MIGGEKQNKSFSQPRIREKAKKMQNHNLTASLNSRRRFLTRTENFNFSFSFGRSVPENEKSNRMRVRLIFHRETALLVTIYGFAGNYVQLFGNFFATFLIYFHALADVTS